MSADQPQLPDAVTSHPGRWRLTAAFAREFVATFHSTGAVLPSSRYLARAMVAELPALPAGRRILEVGPGTGAFTDAILARLEPADTLVAVEINERFATLLQQRLRAEPRWSARARQVHIIHGPIEMVDPAQRFDVVICGLPFNNFPPALVNRIFCKMLDHLSPGGVLRFFEYWGIRRLKTPFVGARERARLAAVKEAIATHLAQHGRQRRLVWRNAPPAVVHYLQRAPAAPTVT